VRYQLASIPEAAQLAELGARRRQVEDAVRDLRIQVDDLTAEQQKADRDVESVKARRDRDRGMVDAGTVANPKDIERMLHELESLERRISDLEDAEIEVMERLETAQQQLAERTAELAAMDEEAERLEAARAGRAGELDRELGEVAGERKLTVDGVPDDLMALYEKLREQKGGVGAAALRARQCGGCRLTLDASILGDIAKRPTDDVIRCEECGRILVRTGESGL
jgi:predicted  nucleic acid-binding Zn-ribbon protein